MCTCHGDVVMMAVFHGNSCYDNAHVAAEVIVVVIAHMLLLK